MKFKKTPMFLSMALAASLMSVPAMAANVSGAGGTGETPVTITAQATTFKVTVPTSIAVNVDANGVATVADASALKIVNESAGAVRVTKVQIQGDAWTLADFNGGDRALLAKEKVNSKQIGLSLKAGETTVATNGKAEKAVDNPAGWTMGGKGVAANGNILPIEAKAIATAVSETIEQANAQNAAKVIFTIGWDTQNGSMHNGGIG